jgi:hypothetical protein
MGIRTLFQYRFAKKRDCDIIIKIILRSASYRMAGNAWIENPEA